MQFRLIHSTEPKAPLHVRLKLRDEFAALLNREARQRPRRQMWERVDGEDNPAWVFAERQAMLARVNTERQSRGLEPVPPHIMRRVENLAFGHSDYDTKYALYAAELSIGEIDFGPL